MTTYNKGVPSGPFKLKSYGIVEQEGNYKDYRKHGLWTYRTRDSKEHVFYLKKTEISIEYEFIPFIILVLSLVFLYFILSGRNLKKHFFNIVFWLSIIIMLVGIASVPGGGNLTKVAGSLFYSCLSLTVILSIVNLFKGTVGFKVRNLIIIIVFIFIMWFVYSLNHLNLSH
jgi:hypothetical protein